jgi:hypothetical protein
MTGPPGREPSTVVDSRGARGAPSRPNPTVPGKLVAEPSPDPDVLVYRMAATDPPLTAEEIGGSRGRASRGGPGPVPARR